MNGRYIVNHKADCQLCLALVEGASLATELGQPGDKYSVIAPHILCFLQAFWVPTGAYIDSNSEKPFG